MNTTPVRPIAVGDRAEFTRRTNRGIGTYRGVVLDITPATERNAAVAIIDMDDNGGRIGVAVEELRPVEQVYLAGGDLTVDADQATASATFGAAERGQGVKMTRDGLGVIIAAYDNVTGQCVEVRLSFRIATEAAVWLNDQMTNPANDYSRTARPTR